MDQVRRHQTLRALQVSIRHAEQGEPINILRLDFGGRLLRSMVFFRPWKEKESL